MNLYDAFSTCATDEDIAMLPIPFKVTIDSGGY
jgi:hypothetical protein